MDQYLEKRCFLLPRREICTLRFLLEGYDGLAFLRTLDAQQALVEIGWSPSRRVDALALLAALGGEISLQEVPFPENLPPL